MRWKIDENIHPDVASFFRSRGHDVATVWSQGLQGTPDANLAKVCQAERRSILTLDVGFANILSYPPEAHAGIVVLRLVNQSRASLMRVVEQVVERLEKTSIEGTLWVIDEDRIRVRVAGPDAQ